MTWSWNGQGESPAYKMTEQFDHLIGKLDSNRQETFFLGSQLNECVARVDHHDGLFRSIGLDPTPAENGF